MPEIVFIRRGYSKNQETLERSTVYTISAARTRGEERERGIPRFFK